MLNVKRGRQMTSVVSTLIKCIALVGLATIFVIIGLRTLLIKDKGGQL